MARTRAAKSSGKAESSSTSSKAKGHTGTGDKIEDYGDESSSYWPEGWNFTRYLNAEQRELFALPEGELEKLLAGFKDVLGEEGNLKMAAALEEWEERKHQEQEQEQEQEQPPHAVTSVPSLRPGFAMHKPNWLQFYQRFQGQDWGFVAFKVGRHPDDSKWAEFKEKFENIVRLPFRSDESISGVKEAEEHFRIQWVEDPEFEKADAKQIQGKLATIIPTMSIVMSQKLCLAATPVSVSHLLEAPTPDADSRRWRLDPPYVLGVSADADPGLEEDHEEREWFQEVFKVAAETIVDELWSVLEGLEWPVRRVTRGIKGVLLVDGEEVETEDSQNAGLEDVWWSTAPSPERMSKRRRLG